MRHAFTRLFALPLICMRIASLLTLLGLLEGPWISLAGAETFATTNFDFEYTTSGNGAVAPPDDDGDEDPPYSLPGNFTLPTGCDDPCDDPCNDTSETHPNFVVKLACWLEYSWDRYDTAGFDLPSGKVLVQVENVPNTGAWVPAAQRIEINPDQRMSSLPMYAAHELFHVVQYQYWTTLLGRPGWFLESLPEAMAVALTNDVSKPMFDFDPDGHTYDAGFLMFPPHLMSKSYKTWPMWSYVMEHSGSPTPVYPGFDFIRQLMENTRDNCPGRTLACMKGELDILLAAEGTDFPTMMRRMSVANMLSIFDDTLDFDHIYGYRWDDVINSSAGDVLDVMPGEIPLRFDLAWDTHAALPGFSVTTGGAQIYEDYGTQYWQFENNLRARIASAVTTTGGSLRYSGPGAPYEVLMTQPSGTTIYPATQLTVGDGYLTRARFDDDRARRAVVAMHGSTAVNFGSVSYTLDPYRYAQSVGTTRYYDLDAREILMLGIENVAASHISAIMYWDNPLRNDDFQAALRHLTAGGVYDLVPDADVLTPSNEHGVTNLFVHDVSDFTSGGPASLRLDLRDSPIAPAAGPSDGVWVTLYDGDIRTTPLPDLLISKQTLTLDLFGRVRGDVHVLNQGTADAVNVRVPIFVNGVQVMAPYVDIAQGQVYTVAVDHYAGTACADTTSFSATVEAEVNSNLGLSSGSPLVSELSLTNNNPQYFSLIHDCLEIISGPLGDFFDETSSEFVAKTLDDGFELLNDNFSSAVTDELLVLVGDLLPHFPPFPPHFPEESWGDLLPTEWFEHLVRFMDAVGWSSEVPDTARDIAALRDIGQALPVARAVLGGPAIPSPDPHRCGIDEPCALVVWDDPDRQYDGFPPDCGGPCDVPVVQSTEQTRCLDKTQKALAKAAAVRNVRNQVCLRLGHRGTVLSVDGCLIDSSDRKLQRAGLTVVQNDLKSCPVAPDFGYQIPDWSLLPTMGAPTDMVFELFGDSLDTVVVVDPSRDAERCRTAVLKAMGKQTAGQSKAFGKCLKTGLRSGAIASKTTLSECVDAMRADPGSKVAKLATKVVSEATRRCEGLVLADMFPGECALASDLGVCASSVAACSVCRRVVRGQELIADCDAFDDGLVNGTCGPRSY